MCIYLTQYILHIKVLHHIQDMEKEVAYSNCWDKLRRDEAMWWYKKRFVIRVKIKLFDQRNGCILHTEAQTYQLISWFPYIIKMGVSEQNPQLKLELPVAVKRV